MKNQPEGNLLAKAVYSSKNISYFSQFQLPKEGHCVSNITTSNNCQFLFDTLIFRFSNVFKNCRMIRSRNHALSLVFILFIGIGQLISQSSNLNYETRLRYISTTTDLEDGTEEHTFLLRVEDDYDFNYYNYFHTCDVYTYYDLCHIANYDSPYSAFPYRRIDAITNTSRQYFDYNVRYYEWDGDGSQCTWHCSDDYAGWYAGYRSIQNGTSSVWRDFVDYTWSGNGVRFILDMCWRYTKGDAITNAFDWGTRYSGTVYHTNSNRSAPSGASSSMGYASGAVWYSFYIPSSKQVTISTAHSPTNYDTYLTLYDANGNYITGDNDSGGGNRAQITNFKLCAGTYKVKVDGYNGVRGDFQVSLNVSDFTVNPGSIVASNTNICQNTGIPIIYNNSSASNGKGTITYNWQKYNGSSFVDISGANGSSYDPPENIGTTTVYYRRRATDQCGTTVYTNYVTINPIITAINGGTIAYNGYDTFESGTDPGSINSSTNATATPFLDIRWYQRVWNGSSYGGWSLIPNQSGQTYDVPALTQRTQYRREVRNTCGDVANSNYLEYFPVVANGLITGTIKVGDSNIGVDGVTVEARRLAAIPGGPVDVIYTATTNVDGSYSIPNIYYGPSGVDYEVIPTLGVYTFEPADTTVTVNSNVPDIVDFKYVFQGGNILFVDQSYPGGYVGPDLEGTSWDHPFTEIQPALDIANGNAGTFSIYIAKGVYKPTKERCPTCNVRQKTFYINDDVKLYGGFAGYEIGPDQRVDIEGNPTVLSGDLDNNDTVDSNGIIQSVADISNVEGSTQQNAYHVVYIDRVSSETLLDGLIITGGFADGLLADNDDQGGGIYNLGGNAGESSDPQFKNILIVGNAANWLGGGILNDAYYGGDINSTYENVEFRANESYGYGGAMFNWAEANIELDFFNCHFANNYSSGYGGAIFNYKASVINVDHATFLNNEATSAGGAISNWSTGAEFNIFNSSFWDNNTISIDNRNATFNLTNSIISGENTTSFILGGTPVPYVLNSIIRGGYGNGLNIYNEEPYFVPSTTQPNSGSTIGGYLKLEPCSNAVDKGDNALITAGITTDLLGNPRIQDGHPGGDPGLMPDGTDAIVDLGPYEILDPFEFTASTDVSDAWIQLNWQLDPANCECLSEDFSQQQGVFVELRLDDGTLLMSWQIYEENFTTQPYTGQYKHYVGPSQTRNYRLEMNRVGPGTTNCHQNVTGSTSDFLTPIVIATEDLSPDSTKVTWTSRSWMGDLYNIYRDSILIGTVNGQNIPGGTFEFSDVFRMNDTTSMVNGEVYEYFVETVSTRISEDPFVVPQKGLDFGNSMPIGLMASDNNPVDKVDLTWINMSAYCDQIRVVREGSSIGVLTNNVTSFSDLDPFYGEQILYGVELMRDGVPYVGSYDLGGAPPNGVISGYVLTRANNYPVKDVMITLKYETDGEVVEMVTTTDFKGSYSFEGLFYNRMNTFELTAMTSSTLPFLENPLYVDLDLDKPTQDNVIFYETDGYDEGMVFDKLVNFTATPIATEDRMQLDWTYVPTVDTITYFNLYRGTTLIAQINDKDTSTTVFTFSDLNGIPEAIYEYKIAAFQLDSTMHMDTTVFATDTFPLVAPVTTLNVAETSPNKGVLEIDWAHSSTNFSGFRLYRNGIRVLETVPTDFDYIDLGGRPDSMEFYYVTAFRRVEDVDYESIPFDTVYHLYPGLPAVTNITAIAQASKDLTHLTWTVPAALIPDYNYTGFHLYRTDASDSTILLRTVDASFAEAGEVIEVDDRSGIPDTSYTYEVKTFLEAESEVYEKNGAQITENFPSVSIPLNVVSNSSVGKVEISWNSPHSSTNYEGFAIYKKNTFEELGEIGIQYQNVFSDYVYNPDQDTIENYSVATFRIVNKVRYYSDTISINSDPPTAGEPKFFTSFTASRDQANHVKVCWTWGSEAARPMYVILREGLPLDTLPSSARSYYDYGAPHGVDVEYSIYAFYDDPITDDSNGDESFTTDELFALGKIPSMKSISGRVYKSISGKGVANVEIIAQSISAKYQNRTKTDNAGYYEFNDVPNTRPIYRSTNAPIFMTPVGANHVYESTIHVPIDRQFSSIKLRDITGTHTYLGDLQFRLRGPDNQTIDLLLNKCGGNDNFRVSFDDESATSANDVDCPYIGNKSYVPLQPLSTFDGISSFGDWTLSITDIYNLDGGSFESWGIEFVFDDITLTADSINTAYIENPQTLSTFQNIQDYTVNFVDTFDTPAVDMEVSPVLALTATPQPAELAVLLNWSPENENYSGFEIFRGQELIGEVLANNPPMFLDEEGINGVFTLYFVRAFLLTENGKMYSDFANTGTDYPILEPVDNLTLTPLEDKNVVSIQWSHPYDSHDFYLIKRNGVAISAVNTGNPMIVMDTTGSPGELYNYAVTAWNGATESDVVSDTLRYPAVYYLNTLEVSAPIDTANENNSMNHLLLEWTYPDDIVDSFVVIRYNRDNFNNKLNEVVMARLSNDARSFIDYTGEPGLIYHYDVLAMMIRNEQEYYSLRRNSYSDSELHPVIGFPTMREADGNLSKGWMELSFNYLYPTVDSFVVTRVGTLNPIEIIKDSSFEAGQSKTAIDQTGIPEQNYTYQVQAFSVRNGKVFASTKKDFNPSPISFPKVPSPTMPFASDGEFNNKINFSWEYDDEIAIDGFRLKRKFSYENTPNELDEESILPSGRRMISDGDPILQELDPNDLVEYYVEAYRIVPQVGTYFSDPVLDDGYVFSGRYAPMEDNPYHRLGRDVSLGRNGIQDWAIVGSDEGVAYIYKKVLDGSWVHYQTLSPAIPSSSFGRSVSISGKYAVVGAPYESSSRGAAYIFNYNNATQQWEEMDYVTHPNRNYYDYFGWSVDILDETQDFLIVGAHGDDNNNSSGSGSALIFKRNGTNWTFNQIENSGVAPAIINASEFQNDANFGKSVAIGKTTDNNYFAVVGVPEFDYPAATGSSGDLVGQAYIFKLTNSQNNEWGEIHKINPSDRNWCCNRLGISVDISKNLIIIGERAYDRYSFKGGASVFTYNSPNWNLSPVVLTANPSEGHGFFGTDVSIISGTSNNYALISENPNSHDERVYLFKQDGASWVQQSPVYNLESGVDHNFGASVAIGEFDALVGAPNHDNERGIDAGSIHFYPVGNGPVAPSFVDATDNQFTNKVTITWVHSGSGVQQFQILRDGLLIGAVSSTDAYLFDDKIDENDLTPGKKHFYEVVAKSPAGILSDPGSDFGSILANGVIEGKVTANDGVSPVENVELYASAIVDGEKFDYGPVISAGDGTYSFTQLYYGESADFRVWPVLEGHEFDPVVDSINLEKNGSITPPTAIEVNFRDITAYSINGYVRHQSVQDCGIEGVELEYRSVLQNGTVIINKGLSSPIITDEDGFYSFVIDPFLANLDSIVVVIKDTMLIGMSPAQDTFFYDFIPQGAGQGIDEDGFPYFTDFDNINQFSKINFLDQTTYDIDLAVKNTCGEPLNDDHFSVRAFTQDGCYQQEILLSSAGEGTITLPPLDLIIAVSDVDFKTGTNLVYLEKLMNSPIKLDLYSFHKDTARFLTPAEVDDSLFTQFIFHKPPRIMADFAMLDDECSETGIITQNDIYSIPISVVEEFASGDCAVNEGYLKITNGAARTAAPDTIYYDASLGGFADYEFEAGDPNVVSPYVWNLSIEYFSNGNQFLGSTSKAIFVEGEVGIPGNGIMVDAGSGTQEVPMPLYVLRDPPGDASFSTIAQGQTINRSFSWAKDVGKAVSLDSKTSFKVAGVGASVNISASIGGSKGTGASLELTTTTSQEISTSDSEDAIGQDGDVIVGAGLAMQYGLKSVYTYEGCDSEGLTIKEVRKVGFTPNSITTTWVYSKQFVQKLVDDFNNDIPLLASGEKVIEENGKAIPAADAVRRFKAYRDNWQQVLEYHQKETNPFYHLCTGEFGPHANLWRDALLDVLDLDGDNKPDLDIVFNDARLTAYNNTAYAIRGLTNQSLPLAFRLNTFGYTSSRFSDENFAPEGEMAKNITFEGNAGAFTESYGQSKSYTNSITSTFFKEASVGGGLSLDIEGTIFLGLGGGTIVKITEIETEINASVTATANLSKERAINQISENFVSYTLDDDDPGDEISVTVLKSIDIAQTPFFQLLGGETSCPPEEGSINRDDPIIQVLDPTSGLPGLTASKYFQPANAATDFTIRVVNNSPTGEVRGYEVFLDNASNPDNAEIRLNGIPLRVNEFPNEDPYDPQDLTLSVSRGSAFDYENLRIGIRPLGCGGTPAKYITINVGFVTPCSPVTIVQPNNNWLMNSSKNELVIGIRDYQPDIDILEEFELQYRRVGGSDPSWKFLPYPYLIDENNPVDAATLQAWNFDNFGPGEIPTYYFVWQLPNNTTQFPDGNYELRVVATCKEGTLVTKTYSNVVSGSINRTRLQLFGVPQPSDGFWTPGDLIAAEFNKNVDCNLFDDPEYINDYCKVEVDGNVLPEANFTCLNNEVRITLPDMTLYDGKRMYVTLDSIVDPTGNLAINIAGTSRTITWDFLVITGQAYWEQDSIVVELYEGETLDVVAGLKNVELSVPLNNISVERTTASSAWLTSNPAFGANFSINPGSIRPINLSITGTTEGIYTDTITVAGLSGSSTIPKLPVKVIVNKRPPYPPDWQVDSGQYPNSMTVVANFKYVGDTDYSRDTLDQISVFIGNSLRGVARIQDAGNGFHVAYLNIYGSSADDGRPLEFRVWDSKDDIEYDGHPDPDTLKFAQSTFVGKTSDPIILYIDVNKDRARYIHLNQGWTWFSLNSVEDSMGTNYLLRGLKNPAIGDRLLSQNSFAEYVHDTIGWYAPQKPDIEPLDILNTEDSYMIYLANQVDSIRITGVDATPVSGRVLFQGWSWVGYPHQVSQAIEDAFDVINIQPDDQIRSKDSSAIWLADNSWDGPMTSLVPNEGYKIQINTGGAVLNYNNPAGMPDVINTPSYDVPKYTVITKSMVTPADTTDASTWNLNYSELAFQDVVPVVGEVLLNNAITGTGKVAVFLDTDLRGVAQVTFDSIFNKPLFTLFIGINSAAELNDLRFFYATDNGTVLTPLNPVINLTQGGGNLQGVYNYNSPLTLIFEGGLDCAQSVLTIDDLDIASGLYHAIDTLKATGVVQDLSDVTFKAGNSIYLNSQFEVEGGGIFFATPENCNSAQPDPVDNSTIKRVDRSIILHKGGIYEHKEIEIVFNERMSNKRKVFIDYYLEFDNMVSIDLINAKGQHIKKLMENDQHEAGKHRYSFPTKGLESGRYMVKFTIGKNQKHITVDIR